MPTRHGDVPALAELELRNGTPGEVPAAVGRVDGDPVVCEAHLAVSVVGRDVVEDVGRDCGPGGVYGECSDLDVVDGVRWLVYGSKGQPCDQCEQAEEEGDRSAGDGSFSLGVRLTGSSFATFRLCFGFEAGFGFEWNRLLPLEILLVRFVRQLCLP